MTLHQDQIFQFGGVPVASDSRFEGWWGKKVLFVDYDNGTVGAVGDHMNYPTKHLRVAINNAEAGDTIYVRPRDFSSEDPQAISPDTAANWNIPKAKHELSIIGTGKGWSHPAAHMTFLTGYSALTTPILSIYAPGCVIENLRSQPGSSTSGIFYSVNDATYDGGNTTFINNDFHDGGTAGALNLASTWQMSIIGNRFVNCDKGIYVTSSYSVPQIWEVSDNIFNAIITEVRASLHALGGLKRFTARRNVHTYEKPTGGAPNMYYSFAAASTGMIAGDDFGVYDLVAENFCTLNGVHMSGCHSIKGLIVEAS